MPRENINSKKANTPPKSIAESEAFIGKLIAKAPNNTETATAKIIAQIKVGSLINLRGKEYKVKSITADGYLLDPFRFFTTENLEKVLADGSAVLKSPKYLIIKPIE